ncbi:MAG: radical SAM protein, partial [Candidatus Aminicenantes bacterium]|nr:radical SAM protein [Candidatus Aminicenantes bacterium]
DLTIYLTDDCNFHCSYCYQTHSHNRLDTIQIQRGLNFFLPRLKEESYIKFYGGEPLLAFETIEETVHLVNKKNVQLQKTIHFGITTNGSLITDSILQFLQVHGFLINLSYDGLAQDHTRENQSRSHIVSIIHDILNVPGISLKTNSVFTPQTVGLLSRSMEDITEMGVPSCSLALDTFQPWSDKALFMLDKQLTLLGQYLLSNYKRFQNIPVTNFRKRIGKGIYICMAGQDRMVIAPDGRIWGCFMFVDFDQSQKNPSFAHDYCFGKLKDFQANYDQMSKRIRSNYSKLRMNNFYTSTKTCGLCPNLTRCRVCPVEAAFSSFTLREIPLWRCAISKIISRHNLLFWEAIKKQYGMEAYFSGR